MRFLIWGERANGEPDHAGKGHRSKRQMLRPLQSLRIEHNRTSLIASEVLICRISGCGVCWVLRRGADWRLHLCEQDHSIN